MEFSTHPHSRASDIKRDDDRPRVIPILAVGARAGLAAVSGVVSAAGILCDEVSREVDVVHL